MRAVLIVVLAGLGACDPESLAGLPCPCVEGWTCCEAQNRCLPDGDTCPSNVPTWEAQASGTTARLQAVWGSSPTDVYAVGDRVILHSTGDGRWTPQLLAPEAEQGKVIVLGAWGSGADDVYLVGTRGTIMHSVGDGRWTVQTSGTTTTLYSLWGSARDDVFASGDAGLVLASTGDAAWKATQLPTTVPLLAIGGLSRGLQLAVGGDEVWRATIGSPWTLDHDRSGASFDGYTGVVVAASGANYFVGDAGKTPGTIEYRQGLESDIVDLSANVPAPLHDVWTSDREVFAVGDEGTVLYAPTEDVAFVVEQTPSKAALRGVWGVPNGVVYAVGDAGTILVRKRN